MCPPVGDTECTELIGGGGGGGGGGEVMKVAIHTRTRCLFVLLLQEGSHDFCLFLNFALLWQVCERRKSTYVGMVTWRRRGGEDDGEDVGEDVGEGEVGRVKWGG